MINDPKTKPQCKDCIHSPKDKPGCQYASGKMFEPGPCDEFKPRIATLIAEGNYQVEDDDGYE